MIMQKNQKAANNQRDISDIKTNKISYFAFTMNSFMVYELYF